MRCHHDRIGSNAWLESAIRNLWLQALSGRPNWIASAGTNDNLSSSRHAVAASGKSCVRRVCRHALAPEIATDFQNAARRQHFTDRASGIRFAG